MEVDLASFLSPAGSLLGEVTQRVLDFLSVQDLIEYVASSASSNNSNVTGTAPSDSAAAEEEAGSPENPRRQQPQRSPRGGWVQASVRGGKSGQQVAVATCGGSSSGSSPEGELPHRREKRSSTGAGDEAGGGSRPPTPYRRSDAEAFPENEPEEDEEWGDVSAINGECPTSGDHDDRYGGGEREGWFDPSKQEEQNSYRQRSGGGSGAQVVAVSRRGEGEALDPTKPRSCTSFSREKGKDNNGGVVGILIGLGLHPWAALGALRGGVVHLLGGVPLLALLRWASGGASAVLGLSFRVALLPYDVTKGLVGYVVGSLEAMLNVATEVRRRQAQERRAAYVPRLTVSSSTTPVLLPCRVNELFCHSVLFVHEHLLVVEARGHQVFTVEVWTNTMLAPGVNPLVLACVFLPVASISGALFSLMALCAVMPSIIVLLPLLLLYVNVACFGSK